MKVNRIIETAIYCDSVPEMVPFYRHVFGFELLFDLSERGAFLKCGSSVLIIFNRALTSLRDHKVPSHGSTGPGHIALEIDNDTADGWRKELAEKGVAIEKDMVWEHSGATSLYFRDPAGNSIELTEVRHWNL